MSKTADEYLCASPYATYNIIEAFHDGYLQAVRDFAVHRSGEQFVGCGVYTLGQIKMRVEADRTKALNDNRGGDG